MVIRYYETVYERSRNNMFWSIKKSGEVLSKTSVRRDPCDLFVHL